MNWKEISVKNEDLDPQMKKLKDELLAFAKGVKKLLKDGYVKKEELKIILKDDRDKKR